MQAEVMLKKTIDYLSGHLPGFAELIVKIVICALIYVIGKKLIAKLVRVVRAMLDKSHVSPGAATFVVSMLKIILYLTLILGIAMQFGLKSRQWRRWWHRWRGNRPGLTGWPVQPCRRLSHSFISAVSDR